MMWTWIGRIFIILVVLGLLSGLWLSGYIHGYDDGYKLKQNELWDKIHSLQQSPDKCLSCGGDMEGNK